MEPEAYPVVEWPEDRFGIAEEMRVDGMAEDLYQLQGLVVSDDGVMAVGLWADRQVRLYGPDGVEVGRFGREGEGPGEFERLNVIAWAGDSLWVYDAGLARFTVFGPDFSVARTVTAAPQAAVDGEADYFFYRYLYPDGTVFAFHSGREGQDGPGWTRYLRMEPGGASYTTLARVASDEDARVSVRGDGWSASMVVPYAPQTEDDLSDTGDRIVFVRPYVDGPAVGTFSVTALDATGDTVYANRYPFDLVAISDRVADSVIEMRLGRPGRRPEMDAAFRREAKVPPYYPPFGVGQAVIAGRDGTVWLRMRPTEEGQPYRAIAPDGAPLGTVVLPAGDRLAEAERSTIWVYEYDEMGVPSVVRYGVTR